MDRPRRPEPEKQVLLGLCENQPQPPATAPVRLAGSCLAHRAQQTAKVGFRNIRAYPHHCAADLDLHAPHLGRTRLRRRLALDLLRPETSSATPSEKLRRRDIQRTRQRRNVRARLQRRGDRSILEVVGPAPAFANRRSIEPFGSDLYELVRVGSAHRPRHRCCYPCLTITKHAPCAARMAPGVRLRILRRPRQAFRARFENSRRRRRLPLLSCFVAGFGENFGPPRGLVGGAASAGIQTPAAVRRGECRGAGRRARPGPSPFANWRRSRRRLPDLAPVAARPPHAKSCARSLKGTNSFAPAICRPVPTAPGGRRRASRSCGSGRAMAK